jgi:hypothetical protein
MHVVGHEIAPEYVVDVNGGGGGGDGVNAENELVGGSEYGAVANGGGG